MILGKGRNRVDSNRKVKKSKGVEQMEMQFCLLVVTTIFKIRNQQ